MSTYSEKSKFTCKIDIINKNFKLSKEKLAINTWVEYGYASKQIDIYISKPSDYKINVYFKHAKSSLFISSMEKEVTTH